MFQILNQWISAEISYSTKFSINNIKDLLCPRVKIFHIENIQQEALIILSNRLSSSMWCPVYWELWSLLIAKWYEFVFSSVQFNSIHCRIFHFILDETIKAQPQQIMIKKTTRTQMLPKQNDKRIYMVLKLKSKLLQKRYVCRGTVLCTDTLQIHVLNIGILCFFLSI